MTHVELLLAIIALILFLILIQVSGIAKRLRQRFPTEKEEDYDWSQKDPAGHWAAHKDDKK
jgi:hypothetical protein